MERRGEDEGGVGRDTGGRGWVCEEEDGDFVGGGWCVYCFSLGFCFSLIEFVRGGRFESRRYVGELCHLL